MPGEVPDDPGLATAWEGFGLEERERVIVGILELDGPASRCLADGGEHLHFAFDERLDGRAEAAFVDPKTIGGEVPRTASPTKKSNSVPLGRVPGK